MKKKSLFVAAALLILSVPVLAQLAGTQRIIDHYWFTGDRCIKFGSYPNASICYTGGNLVVDILQGGGKVVFPDGLDIVPSGPFGESIVFEGTTADDFETTLSVEDPTADRSVVIPDQSGTLLMSVAPRGGPNSVTVLSSAIEFEGATADANEGMFVAADVTGDRTWNMPDASGTILLGGNISIVSVANQACAVTCGSSSRCVAGQNAEASNVLVPCNAILADVCICSAN